MSDIDRYSHRILGFVGCPTDYPQLLVYGSAGPVVIAVYEVYEAIPQWSAKPGDIIVGGGAGECPAFRISMPLAEDFLLGNGDGEFNSLSEVCQAYWAPAQAFALCSAFVRLGWNVEMDVELWFAEYVLRGMREGSLLQEPLG